MSENPYAVSASSLSLDPAEDIDSANESIRREHLNTEANLQSIGFFFLIGSVLVLLVAAGNWAAMAARGESIVVRIAETGLIFALGIFQGVIGIGLRRLRAWARWGALALALPGLLSFPLGTLMGAIIIGSLLTKKAKVVVTAEYRTIIRATPHIRYASHWVLRVVLITAFVLIALAAAFVLLGEVAR